MKHITNEELYQLALSVLDMESECTDETVYMKHLRSCGKCLAKLQTAVAMLNMTEFYADATELPHIMDEKKYGKQQYERMMKKRITLKMRERQ